MRARLPAQDALVSAGALPYACGMTHPDPPPAARFDPATLLTRSRGGHAVALGIGYAAHGVDWCELTLDYDRRLVSDATSGILASGPILSLMDMATAAAILCRLGAMSLQATLDLRIDYLRPARPGTTVIGRGECYRLTRRVAFVRGHAHDGDPADPVAHVTGTFMLTGAAA